MLQQKDFLDHDHRAHVMVHHNSERLTERDPEQSGHNYYRVHGGQL